MPSPSLPPSLSFMLMDSERQEMFGESFHLSDWVVTVCSVSSLWSDQPSCSCCCWVISAETFPERPLEEVQYTRYCTTYDTIYITIQPFCNNRYIARRSCDDTSRHLSNWRIQNVHKKVKCRISLFIHCDLVSHSQNFDSSWDETLNKKCIKSECCRSASLQTHWLLPVSVT